LEEFKRLIPPLQRLGLQPELDRACVVGFCQSWADNLWCIETIQAEGRLLTASNGARYLHPAVKIQRAALSAMLKFATELGMTPAARNSLGVLPESLDDDPDDEFFGAGRDDSFERFQRNERRRARAKAKKAVKPHPEESGEPLG
jgi:P27 family predicted phage terminase small subunit